MDPLIPRDPVIERVRADLLRRQQLDYQKYGGTLTTNPAGLRGALQHAYEEALDLCNYLQWSMMQLDGSSELTPDETHNTGLKVNPICGQAGCPVQVSHGHADGELLNTVQRDKLAHQIQHWVENYDPKLLENVSLAALQDELQRRQLIIENGCPHGSNSDDCPDCRH